MKIKVWNLSLVAVFTFFLSSLTQAGLILQPQSKLSLEGDSTLHKYSSTAAQIKFSADVSTGGTSLKADDLIKRGMVKNLQVIVPVGQLRSGEKGLDKNMVKALKGGDYPNIIFRMDSYKIISDSATPKISATGTLSIAGVKKPITLSAAIKFQDNHVIIDGQQPLLMTDFGIKPPRLMLGTIKCDNHITVKFHLELEQTAGDPKIKVEESK